MNIGIEHSKILEIIWQSKVSFSLFCNFSQTSFSFQRISRDALHHILENNASSHVSLSALEIYNEKVVDLLSKSTMAPVLRPGERGAYVEGLENIELNDTSSIAEVSLLSVELKACII